MLLILVLLPTLFWIFGFLHIKFINLFFYKGKVMTILLMNSIKSQQIK